jgi:predicted metal-dependent hydrolase
MPMTAPAAAAAAEIDVKLRRMKFAMTGAVPRYWVQGSKFLTHWFNAMSVVFPEGEKFFIDSVRHFEDEIKDPTLREQVRGFVAQEGHHSFQHRALNAVAAELGAGMAEQEQWIKGFLARLREKLTPAEQLAVTCALEHYTAIWGSELLEYPETMDGVDARMQPLWRWHAAEETEHKAVCYDVFAHAVRNRVWRYFLRAKGQLGATLLFIPILHMIQLRLMRSDPEPTRMRDVLAGLNWIWGNPGHFRRALQRHWLSYFTPGFHPWQHDNRWLLEAWKQSEEARYRVG